MEEEQRDTLTQLLRAPCFELIKRRQTEPDVVRSPQHPASCQCQIKMCDM